MQIKSAILHVNNLSDMTQWYAKLLGLPAVQADREIPFYEFLMDNQVSLMLDDHRNQRGQERYPICMVRTEDIEQAYSYAKANGIEMVLEMQRPHPGLAYFNIADSENNTIMIVQSDWVTPAPEMPVHANHPILHHINSIVIPRA